MAEASLPPPVKAEAFSIPAAPDDQLAQVASSSMSSEGASSFRPMPFSRVSMDTRLALAKHAKHSLDIQYYLLQNDYTGRTLLRAVRDAAQRGVRVRILVDDLYTDSSEDLLLNLAATPNVQIKIFNPFPGGANVRHDQVGIRHLDFARLTHRMHNKSMPTVRSQAGGRNIADEYFFQSRSGNFIDFDLLVAGDAVSQLQAVYDTYWNSPRVYPLEVLDHGSEDLEARRRASRRPRCRAASLPNRRRRSLISLDSVRSVSTSTRCHCICCMERSRLLADDPEKVSGKAEQGGEVDSHIACPRGHLEIGVRRPSRFAVLRPR